MNDTPTQSALREWRAHIFSLTALSALLGVSFLLALTGPFGTDVRLTHLPRFGYWLVIVVLTYGTGSLLNTLIAFQWRQRLPMVALVAMGGIATGIGVAMVVAAVNYAVFAYLPPADALLGDLGRNFIIGFVISGLFYLANRDGEVAKAQQAVPSILDRLPLDKRGPLVALSVEDHYVRIITTKGQEVVLLRLSDAIREAGDKGMQVHRSHWIAPDQVNKAKRQADRAILTMSTGTEIPVSRSYLPAVREAGLLPRHANA